MFLLPWSSCSSDPIIARCKRAFAREPLRFLSLKTLWRTVGYSTFEDTSGAHGHSKNRVQLVFTPSTGFICTWELIFGRFFGGMPFFGEKCVRENLASGWWISFLLCNCLVELPIFTVVVRHKNGVYLYYVKCHVAMPCSFPQRLQHQATQFEQTSLYPILQNPMFYWWPVGLPFRTCQSSIKR